MIEVGRAATPLFRCAEGDFACLDQAGADLRPRVEEATQDLEDALVDADADCLREGGEMFLRALRSYKAAAIAAQGGDDLGVGEALDRAEDLQIQGQERLSECDVASQRGSNADMLREMQRAFRSVQGPSKTLANCETFDCLSREGARLEDTIALAVADLEPRVKEAENDCVREAGELALSALDAYRQLGVAAQEGDEEAAIQASNRGYDLELQSVERLRSCASGR